jgi:predicted Zn-dependent peptidase
MPIEFRRTTLSNGLEIVAEVDADAHTAAAGFFVKAGARDEDSAVMGVSHFLEHMMFKGTATRSAEDVDRDFDDIGADHNAFTTGEMTAFWAHALPEQLPRAVEVLADILRPALRQEDFDDEKNVILEEIAMYDDQPFWVVYERALECFFRSHPMGHRVLGTRQTVGAMQRDQMQAYFSRRYSADNTTVAFAGRIDFEALTRQLDQHCGAWSKTDVSRDYPALEHVEDTFTIESDTVNRHYAISLAPAPSLQDERRYAAAMLACVLGDAEGSRLYWALVETGLAEEARAQYSGHDRTGTFLVYYTCPPDDAEAVDRVIADQIDNLLDSVTSEDLERIRSKIATSATLQGELPAGRMQRLGRLWTYTGEYRSLDEELERINAVTLDDVIAVGRAYPWAPRVTGHLCPSASSTQRPTASREA